MECNLEFREACRVHFEGQSISDLSKRAKVDRSVFYKARRGEKISLQAAKAIGKALGLSPGAYEDFMKAHASFRGNGNNEIRRKRIEEFIVNAKNMGELFSSGHSIIKVGSQDLSGFFKDIQAVNTSLNIRKVLSLFLEHEAAKEKGEILIKLQPDKHFEEMFFSLIDNHVGLRIEHIFSFLSTGKPLSDSSHNIERLSHIMPFMVCGCDYVPLMYYEAEQSEKNRLLPNLVITGDCVMCIDSSFEQAVLYRTREMIDFFKRQFGEHKKLTSMLAKKLAPLEFIMQVNSFVDEQYYDSTMFGIAYSPCMIPYFDEALLNSCINKDLVESTSFISVFLQYSAGIAKRFAAGKNSAVYFSMGGIKSFMEEGRLSEIPPQFYTPPSPAFRLRLLEKLIESIRLQKYKQFLIRTEELEISDYLSISGTITTLILSINLPHKPFATLVVEEPGLIAAFHDYLTYFESSKAVYSRDETIALLTRELNHYRKLLA